MAVSVQQEQQIKKISTKYKTSPTFIRAIFGLSRPVLATVIFWLESARADLTQKVTAQNFTAKLTAKNQKYAMDAYMAVESQFNVVKRIVDTLNLGSDFSASPEAQQLLNLFLKGVHVKTNSVTGYRDVDNQLVAARVRLQQAINAADIGNAAVQALNAQINRINTFIQILSEVTNAT